jgi:hypothetical protein
MRWKGKVVAYLKYYPVRELAEESHNKSQWESLYSGKEFELKPSQMQVASRTPFTHRAEQLKYAMVRFSTSSSLL